MGLTPGSIPRGHLVQIWYAKRELFPLHGRVGTFQYANGKPYNARVDIDGISHVIPWGNLRGPQPYTTPAPVVPKPDPVYLL